MKCPKCGEEIASGFQFCTNCGTPVEQEKPAETKGTPDRLEILAAGMESGGRPEPAAEPAPVSEAPPEERPRPRRRRAERPAPAAEDVPDEPRTPEPAPAPEPAPPPAPAPAPAPPRVSQSTGRYAPPVRNKADGPAPQNGKGKQYKRSSGKGVMFWLIILLLVLAAIYVGLCIFMPDQSFTAPAVNLATTVWNYLSASWKDMLWFPIALGAIIVLAVLKAVLGKPLRRKLHASDLAEARDLANRVVVVETLAPPHQVHAEIDEILKIRKTRNQYFPRGRLELDEYAASGVPLEYSCGKDSFTANFVFQRMERSGTRIFMEIIEWQLVDGTVSGRCVQAMRGLEPMLRDTVLDIDSGARIQVYDR